MFFSHTTTEDFMYKNLSTLKSPYFYLTHQIREYVVA